MLKKTELNRFKALHHLFDIKSIAMILVFLMSFGAEAQEADTEEPQPAVKIFGMNLDDEESEDDQMSQEETEALVAPKDDNRTTAEKLEDLKGEVLAVNRDLFILEEDLLFPASTQMATYFSVDVGQFFKLDNIKVKIDDKQVSHYLYTEKDVKALHRGAIQKLHLDNISTGEHELVAILIGIGPRKREYRKAVSFKFVKGTEPKSLEIQLRDDTGKLQPKLNVVEW